MLKVITIVKWCMNLMYCIAGYFVQGKFFTPLDTAYPVIWHHIRDGMGEYMYGYDFVNWHRYQWVSCRHCQGMCVLSNGVGCRAPIKQQAPYRELPNGITKTSAQSCHLRGQLAHIYQTLSEAAVHSRPPCVHLTSLA